MPSRERSFRAEAVVLRHYEWGEADRILVLYTRQMGKVRAIAKGVRKVHSRKAGHLEPFTQAAVQLARGRDLLIVQQAETVDAYLPLREDLLLVGFASYVIELLDRFTYEEDENPALYQLLVDTLARLTAEPDAQKVVRYYELRLLDLAGFRPQLFRCAADGEEIQPEDQFFSAAQGGALCPLHGRQDPVARPVSREALKYLRHFQRSTYPVAARTSIPPAIHREIEGLMQHYITYVLERGLNTPKFLKRVRENRTRMNID